MKKTNKTAKRIVSVILAMSIVLSFALVSVSAAAANPTANPEPKGIVSKGISNIRSFEFNDADDGITLAGGATTALDTTTVAKGTYSMVLTPSADTVSFSDNYTIGNGAGFGINTNDYKLSGTQFFNVGDSPNNYLTMFVYAEEAGAKISVYDPYGMRVGNPVILEAGVWTAYDCLVGADKNSNNIIIAVENASGKKVYFDNVKVQQVTAIADAALTQDSFEFDYETQNTATVEYTSTVDLKPTTVSAPEGVTAVATVADDKLTVNLSGVAVGNSYDLTIALNDVFGRTTQIEKSVTMPAEGSEPMDVVDWSIADGATNVLAPVNYVYLDAPKAIDNATLEAADFTIEGIGASVTAATLVDADTIKVTLDGVLPAETYTLSVDNVANEAGGILSGSITFTTVDGVNGPFVLNGKKTIYQGFENMEYDDEKGKYIIPSTFAGSQGASVQPLVVANDKAHTGTYSIASYKNTSHDYYGGATGFWINHTPRNKEYIVSFWYYSDTWTPNGPNDTSDFEIVDLSRGTLVGDVHYSSTTKSQWNKITFRYIPTAEDAILIGMRDVGANGSCVYFDDFTVQEAGAIGQPVIFAADGGYADTLEAGATFELPIAADVAAGAVMVFVVQYGDNNKMISATPYTNAGSGAAITFTVPDTTNKTKVIIMNATSYAPLCDAYAMNY